RAELGRIWRHEAAAIGRFMLAAQAAIDGKANAQNLAESLDKDRLAKWRKALESKADADDFANTWRRLSKTAAGPDFDAAWRELARQLVEQSREHAEFNAKHFTPFGDFRHAGDCAPWEKSGQGTAEGPTSAGTIALHAHGDGPLATVLPAGLYTHGLSRRL